MPELPEVETTRLGIQPHISRQVITDIVVRQPRLRWPVSPDLADKAILQPVIKVKRRGKYLLVELKSGHIMIHLGMSGSLRILSQSQAVTVGKHDHVDFHFDHGQVLRFTDPRRFGSIFWLEGDPQAHDLLKNLGPEPLLDAFTGAWLHRRSRGRKVVLKNFIMDSQVVVGVGNIYANEALFEARLRPGRRAGNVSLKDYERLVAAIRRILQHSIERGGTTLRDFVGGDGKPGYFKQSLMVYGRGDQECLECSTTLKEVKIGQRSSVYCPHCQR